MPRIITASIAALGLAIAITAAACTGAGPAAQSSSPNPTAAETNGGAGNPVAGAASSGDVAKGQAVFRANCAGCHGQNAEGLGGPDLRHIASSRDRDFLTRWISDPPAVKPGTSMPKLNLNDSDLKAVVDYLLTLK